MGDNEIVVVARQHMRVGSACIFVIRLLPCVCLEIDCLAAAPQKIRERLRAGPARRSRSALRAAEFGRGQVLLFSLGKW